MNKLINSPIIILVLILVVSMYSYIYYETRNEVKDLKMRVEFLGDSVNGNRRRITIAESDIKILNDDNRAAFAKIYEWEISKAREMLPCKDGCEFRQIRNGNPVFWVNRPDLIGGDGTTPVDTVEVNVDKKIITIR